jgi:hypothetical protein
MQEGRQGAEKPAVPTTAVLRYTGQPPIDVIPSLSVDQLREALRKHGDQELAQTAWRAPLGYFLGLGSAALTQIAHSGPCWIVIVFCSLSAVAAYSLIQSLVRCHQLRGKALTIDERIALLAPPNPSETTSTVAGGNRVRYDVPGVPQAEG